ncbi:MAG TPA: 2'-5' RNA ligase family protein [Gaiellaceae bacterium]|nr:2'-5' RNA ligase family protein [Gaiellaceae bacterium]
MESDERLRLFCALLLPPVAIDGLVAWQLRELRAADGLRIVPRENLHVTLAFLGSTGRSHLSGVVEAVRFAAAEVEPPLLEAVRYRETKSVGMIVLADEADRATGLAERLWDELEGRGVYEREGRKWLPHVTVARFRSRPRLSPPVPDLRDVVPSDAAVMISRLRPGGAQYEVFETVSLGG